MIWSWLSSLLPGAVIARPLLQSTKKLLPLSKRRTLLWSRSTAQKKQTSAKIMALRDIPQSKSSEVWTILSLTPVLERPLRTFSRASPQRTDHQLIPDSIISYMTKQSLPAVSALTADTIEEFKTADKVVLIAYFEADDKTSNETFTSIADSLRDSYLFGATSDTALAKAEGVKQPAIVLYKDFDEGKNTFTEKFDAAAIEDFAKKASIPLVGEVGPETYAGYMEVSTNDR
jgi:hypothetical protein